MTDDEHRVFEETTQRALVPRLSAGDIAAKLRASGLFGDLPLRRVRLDGDASDLALRCEIAVTPTLLRAYAAAMLSVASDEIEARVASPSSDRAHHVRAEVRRLGLGPKVDVP